PSVAVMKRFRRDTREYQMTAFGKVPEGQERLTMAQVVARPEEEVLYLAGRLVLHEPEPRGQQEVWATNHPWGSRITLVPSRPVPVLTTDVFGKFRLPAYLLEIRNGVALVRIEDYWTVRSLVEVRRDDTRRN